MSGYRWAEIILDNGADNLQILSLDGSDKGALPPRIFPFKQLFILLNKWHGYFAKKNEKSQFYIFFVKSRRCAKF